MCSFFPKVLLNIIEYKIFPFAHYSLNVFFSCVLRYEEDKKQWVGVIREMRYAASASCMSMRLNAAKMPKL